VPTLDSRVFMLEAPTLVWHFPTQRAALVALLAATLTGCAGRATTPAPRADRSDGTAARLSAALDSQVPALLARYQVASVGVALVEDGRVTLERAYGAQAPGVPATGATLFNLASLTKPVAAETILRLASAGRLSLDEPMSPYWVDPDVAGDPRHARLTPRLALAHQTGLPNWRGRSPGGRLAFAFDPGTAYGYSGEGYDYAARFAEKRLGQSFEALAQARVLDPLRMTSTAFSARGWMRGRLALPLDSAGRWGAPQVQDSGEWNAGNNLITTVGDYARFVASVMKGEGLTPSLVVERLRPTSGPQPRWSCKVAPPAVCPRAVAMALGWMRLDYERGPVMLHTGSNSRPGGEQTVAYLDLRRRRGVVVLTSGTNGKRLYLDVLDLVDPGSPVIAYLRQPE
jgi:CubicO group peptidase (beta-lactamase class C family)